MDWRLSLFVLFTGLIQLIVPKFTVKPVAKAEKDYIEKSENYTISLKEIFSAFDLIKSYNLQEKIEILHRNANTGYKKASFKDRYMSGFMGSLGDFFSSITYIGVFFLGAVLVLLGFFKISVIIAASQLVIFIVYPLSNLTQYITSILAAKAVIKDLDEILNLQEKDSSLKDLEAKTSFEDSISFENMSFSYPQDGEDEESEEENHGTFPALKNINLTIKKGEKVLIVGESGSGKSTLLSLLYKKFTGYEGLIKMDGTFDSIPALIRFIGAQEEKTKIVKKTTDSMYNYANNTDVYQIWADMVAFGKIVNAPLNAELEKYFCVYVSRRDTRNYVHTHEEIIEKYNNQLVMYERMPDLYSAAMGNNMYTAKFLLKEDMDEFVDFVHKIV